MFYGVREVLNDVKWAESLGLTPGVSGKEIVVQGFGNGENIKTVFNF